MKRLIFILFILIGSNNAIAHKFYISIADMEYDSIKNRINVSLKLTAHDFEMVLERKFERKIVLEEVVDSSKEAGYIRQYLKVNFQLFSQEQQLEMSYLGYEVNNKDELYFYFFFKDVPDPTTIKIINKLLFSISDQQQNIVHYKYSGQTKSVTLISAKSEDRITFNEDEDK